MTKDDKVLATLISAGIEFQITGAKYWIEPLPNITGLILGVQSFWGLFDLNPNKAELFEGSFSGGRGGSIFPPPSPPSLPFHISRRTYPNSIKLYTIVK